MRIILWFWCLFLLCVPAVGRAVESASFTDLTMESVQVQPPNPTSDQELTARGFVRNAGSRRVAGFDVSVAVRQKGDVIRAVENAAVSGPLPKGGHGLSVPVRFGKLAPGDYEILMRADPSNRVKEMDEKNNEKAARFRVRAARVLSS